MRTSSSLYKLIPAISKATQKESSTDRTQAQASTRWAQSETAIKMTARCKTSASLTRKAQKNRLQSRPTSITTPAGKPANAKTSSLPSNTTTRPSNATRIISKLTSIEALPMIGSGMSIGPSAITVGLCRLTLSMPIATTIGALAMTRRAILRRP